MFNGRLAAAVVLALVMTGCTGKIIQENMDRMVGLPADRVFDKLGLPDAESEVAGRKFYIWETSNQGFFSAPLFSAGTVFSSDGSPLTHYTYTTFNQVDYNRSCKLRVFVDALDVVTTYDYEGNEGGCYVFANQLSE